MSGLPVGAIGVCLRNAAAAHRHHHGGGHEQARVVIEEAEQQRTQTRRVAAGHSTREVTRAGNKGRDGVLENNKASMTEGERARRKRKARRQSMRVSTRTTIRQEVEAERGAAWTLEEALEAKGMGAE